jgi:hypothetical protein
VGAEPVGTTLCAAPIDAGAAARRQRKSADERLIA